MNTMQKKMANTIRGIRPAILGSILKSIFFPNRQQTITENGVFYINPCENLGNILINYGVYENSMCSLIKHFSKDARVFFDIGANEGYFSVIAKLQNKNLIVHSFEPQKRLLNVIEKNCSLNNVSINLHNIALSDKPGDDLIFLASDMNSGGSSLNRKPSKLSNQKQAVTKLTLDQFIRDNNIHCVDFCKVDIEGHEYELIKGANECLKKKIIKNIIIEYHPTIIGNEKVNEIDHAIKSCGYRIENLFGQTYYLTD